MQTSCVVAVGPGVAWTRMVVGAELPFTVDIGPGLRLPRWGRGVILASGVRIGSGVTNYHRVTIGINKGMTPTVGNRVYIGTGADVLGGITVAEDAVVGANAVVVRDSAAGVTVGGVPASPLREKSDRQTVLTTLG